MPYRFVLTLVIIFSFVLSGCAAQGNSFVQTGPPCLNQPVKEPLHPVIQDESVKSCLQGIDPARIPEDDRLEVLIYRELAEAKTAKDLDLGFDRLWDEQERVRQLVQGKISRNAPAELTVLLYHLLNAGEEPTSWRHSTAETLYRDTLSGIAPGDLSGYGLHFYTYALLNVGRFEAARPCLKELRRYTSADIYTADQVISVTMAASQGAGRFVSQVLTELCTSPDQAQLNCHDQALFESLRTLSSLNGLSEVRSRVLPLIPQHPQLQQYRFVQFLENPEQDHQEIIPATKPATQDVPRAGLVIQAIQGSNKSRRVDPRLGETGADLANLLDFTGFELLQEEHLFLARGQAEKLDFGDGINLELHVQELDQDRVKLRVQVREAGKTVFKNTIYSQDKGDTILSGPARDGTLLLLRLVTHVP